MDYKERYREWLSSDTFDDNTKEELKLLEGNEKEIEDRFYKELEFGTGGLRAVIGAGSNRLNLYTIRRITRGYGEFLLENYGDNVKQRGVVIAHDVRHYSSEFAFEVGLVLASLGIPTYLFREATTTPELSFSVPYLNAVGGIVITASHNPPQYNGYKIYDETGCQAVPALAKAIITKINEIEDYGLNKVANSNSNLIHWLDEEIDTAFINAEKSNLVNLEKLSKIGRNIKILYTPLHGTGKKAIFRGLSELGFSNVFTVKEQLVEDPNFSTVKSPNPEDTSAFSMALKVAKENDVDLILGTDPDCDRVGVLAKTNKYEYKFLNGNQIGSLLVNYVLETDKDLTQKKYPFIAKTIVTSDLGANIAKKYNVQTISTLTGFKFIGEQINTLEKRQDFIMGFEESYGYLVGSVARDKDAVGATMIIAEMAAYYLEQGKTLFDQLEELFNEFGIYKEELISKDFYGREGMESIETIMNELRNISSEKFLEYEILQIKDYSLGIDGLPPSNVLKFIFKNESWIAIRPSGTEPKIKFYLGVKGTSTKEVDTELKKLKSFIAKYDKLK